MTCSSTRSPRSARPPLTGRPGIEKHAYWIRHGTTATGEDIAFAASVDEAVYLVGRALDDAVSEMTDAAA